MNGKKLNALQEFIDIVNGMKDMPDEEKKATIEMARKAVRNEDSNEDSNGSEEPKTGKSEKGKQELFNSKKEKAK